MDVSTVKAKRMSEPGLDLHEWETRWAELQELTEGAPDEACRRSCVPWSRC